MKNKKQIRIKFRNDVFERDNHKCLFCEKESKDAHHITDRNEMPNGGYVKENGISVCELHHLKCEKFHITDGQQWDIGFHPNDLYKLIKSSYITALMNYHDTKDVVVSGT